MTADDADRPLTLMIKAAREGDEAAKSQLIELAYEDLRRIASRVRGVGQFGHTMQATALANEAYLSLQKHFVIPALDDRQDRAAFFGIVALAMRRILKDYWEKKNAKKRGEGRVPVPLQGDVPDPAGVSEFDPIDFVALDEALDLLEARNRAWFDVVMQRHFAGRSVHETAELLNISEATVKKYWALACAWLRRQLEDGTDFSGKPSREGLS